MKIGFRTPSLKKMLKARTTGRIKRIMKKTINPLYGKKGAGIIANPKKALYNKAYKRPPSALRISLDDSNKKKDLIAWRR